MASMLRSLSARLFPRPPTQWPQYAHDCGWAPKPDQPGYPFKTPPAWQYTASKVIGGVFWFWLMLRWKEDGLHEIFNIHPWDLHDIDEEGHDEHEDHHNHH